MTTCRGDGFPASTLALSVLCREPASNLVDCRLPTIRPSTCQHDPDDVVFLTRSPVPIVIVPDARATQPSSRNERRCNRYERPSSRRFPSVLYAHHLRFSGRHLHPSCRTAVSVCSDCGLEFGSEGLLLSSAYCGLPRFAQRERQSQERRERFEPLVVVRGEETQHHGLLLNTRY